MTIVPHGHQAGDTSPVFRLNAITKRFGATEALRGVDLTLHAGEFVALLGPNGAGKSTLIKILDGVERADTGSVEVLAGERLGIVHQDLGLVDYFTVAENLYFGNTGLVLRPAREAQQARAALARVGLERIHPHRLVESLSLAERTMLAVAKLLDRGARVIVVDELTAGLATSDARWLVSMLREATRRGSTVMMVTHRLREVEGIADRYVVMTDGRVRLDAPAATTSFDDLVGLMTSAPIAVAPADEAPVVSGTMVARAEGVTHGRLGPIDLELTSGTVVGITGTLGSGIHELAYMVAGLLRPARGRVVLAPGTRRACVPAHRESEGTFPEESEEFNLSAGVWRRWRGRSRLIDVRRMRADCEQVARQLDIRPFDMSLAVGRLSGGNQQKTILGRALVDQPDLLVLCEPTRGVDVATRQEIYAQVRAAAGRGTAVLVASSDLEDLAALADTTGLLGAEGRIDRWVGRSAVDTLSVELV